MTCLSTCCPKVHAGVPRFYAVGGSFGAYPAAAAAAEFAHSSTPGETLITCVVYCLRVRQC